MFAFSLFPSPNNKSVLPSRRLAKWPLSLSLSFSLVHYPYPNMNALHDQKGDCRTCHECNNLMEDERENGGGGVKDKRNRQLAIISAHVTCYVRGRDGGWPRFCRVQPGTESAKYMNGGLRTDREDRGDSRLFGQVWAALQRGLCFIIKAAKSLPLFARCAEPMPLLLLLLSFLSSLLAVPVRISDTS